MQSTIHAPALYLTERWTGFCVTAAFTTEHSPACAAHQLVLCVLTACSASSLLYCKLKEHKQVDELCILYLTQFQSHVKQAVIIELWTDQAQAWHLRNPGADVGAMSQNMRRCNVGAMSSGEPLSWSPRTASSILTPWVGGDSSTADDKSNCLVSVTCMAIPPACSQPKTTVSGMWQQTARGHPKLLLIEALGCCCCLSLPATGIWPSSAQWHMLSDQRCFFCNMRASGIWLSSTLQCMHTSTALMQDNFPCQYGQWQHLFLW